MLMKILVIGNFSFSQYGGAKTVANYLVDGYKQAGHEVVTVSFPKTDGIFAKIFSQFLDVFNPKAIFYLKKIIKENNPDIIHLHNIHRDLSAYAAKAVSNMKIPVIVTLHESWALCSNFNLVHGKNGGLKCAGKKSRFEITFPLRNFLIKKFLSSADYIFVPSEFSKMTLVKIGGYEENKVISIHNGVNTRIFIPKNKKLEKNKLGIIFVGRPTAKKGINWLKDVVGSIKKESDLEIKLRIVGGENNIPYEKLPECYGQADVLIQPSLVHETFGLTIAEAMSCGIPVIISNMGAMPEVAGEAGIVVEPGDNDGLKKAIVELAVNKDKRIQSGMLGRKRAEEFFDSDIMCRKYMSYIENLAKRY
ncbi:MAG: hypothetical protein UV20_C0007G0024 [Candidatus Magasanikbacteria bacterium GW2011_GWA2_42_32]|uniref:Glycosyltransferase subfamily 4-like N-terminal domain-containing protein n=1 Tax=Candidatus Magasanikbacteria bacterium GW2011_GWA2_42_32 TaxID=1619039 RepID=A0A0G1A6L3_9BACT|nr:MAG: hypothetical protein UV20_C0007G0024 [Candidatus Magasanikbacteria bacterium GW2011_GWA2_42_32]